MPWPHKEFAQVRKLLMDSSKDVSLIQGASNSFGVPPGSYLVVLLSRRMCRLCQPQGQMHEIRIYEPGAPIDRQGSRVISTGIHVNGADTVARAIAPHLFHRCFA